MGLEERWKALGDAVGAWLGRLTGPVVIELFLLIRPYLTYPCIKFSR